MEGFIEWIIGIYRNSSSLSVHAKLSLHDLSQSVQNWNIEIIRKLANEQSR